MTRLDPRVGRPEKGLALVVAEPGVVELEERPSQPLGPFDVRVHPRVVGLCGTDLAIVDGTLSESLVQYPIVIGHEWSGSVAEVGAHVDRLKVGDSVVVDGMLRDETCDWCQGDRTNLCTNCEELGFTLDGAAGFEVCVPGKSAYRISAATLEQAVFVEPLAVCLTALDAVRVGPQASVLVVGDGTIGLLVSRLLRRRHTDNVTMLGMRPAQRELAEGTGVRFILGLSEAPRHFDLVIDAAGGASAVNTCFRVVGRGGTVLLVGGSGGESVEIRPDVLVDNDISVRGSYSYTARAWRSAIELVETGQVELEDLISHRFDVKEFAQAFDVLRDNDSVVARGKVTLNMSSARPGGISTS
jgi:2-desacetyl-2-hydroxyethyl bacteriochlorophyllide A dehydrogenase